MKIKLCGFTQEASLKTAIESNIDYVGFVFHDNSPRNIDLESAKNLAKIIPSNIALVSVTVDKSIEELKNIYDAINPEYFQLHGLEDLDYIDQIKNTFPNIKIIKAIAIANKDGLKQIEKYEDMVDHILLDNKIPGSGQAFDWDLISNLKTKNDFILSGGLNKDNLIDAITKTNAKIVDISSGIEEKRGEKSSKLITQITTILKNLN